MAVTTVRVSTASNTTTRAANSNHPVLVHDDNIYLVTYNILSAQEWAVRVWRSTNNGVSFSQYGDDWTQPDSSGSVLSVHILGDTLWVFHSDTSASTPRIRPMDLTDGSWGTERTGSSMTVQAVIWRAHDSRFVFVGMKTISSVVRGVTITYNPTNDTWGSDNTFGNNQTTVGLTCGMGGDDRIHIIFRYGDTSQALGAMYGIALAKDGAYGTIQQISDGSIPNAYPSTFTARSNLALYGSKVVFLTPRSLNDDIDPYYWEMFSSDDANNPSWSGTVTPFQGPSFAPIGGRLISYDNELFWARRTDDDRIYMERDQGTGDYADGWAADGPRVLNDISYSDYKSSVGIVLDGAALAIYNGSPGNLDYSHYELLGDVEVEVGVPPQVALASLEPWLTNTTPMQHARPASDVSAGGWQVPPLYEKVNEETPNDASYIFVLDPYGACELALGELDEPGDGNVKLSVRCRGMNVVGGDSASLKAELLQGTTVIAETTWGALGDSYVTRSFLLASGEVASITDWSNLRVRLTADVAAS